uniref:Protein FAM76A n=2 Tax=Trichobilharzia regenti TaxID=157069 RepID=A0AA85IU77_TRIRE|nr:unnamed protein product [Trichobilharzia regenti]
MDQPLFACTKCLRNFPQSEMARSGQACKGCSPHHSAFKQCEYCKSDFKYYVYGDICPKCQSLKSKYGEPQPCSICNLRTAFGNALVCQRCLHYRNRFGEPRQCQSCGNMCAFLKDEASRQKVDGQILCWVCTYNFKLARSKERSLSHISNKRRHDGVQLSDTNRLKSTMDLDSVYNEHLLTISQLQDEIKSLKRQLTLKDTDLLAKDRTIAELRSEMIDMKNVHEDRIQKVKSAGQLEQDRLMATIRQLQKENVSLRQGDKRRRGGNTPSGILNLRHSTSATTLFNPDSPLLMSTSSGKRQNNKTPVSGNRSGNQTITITTDESDSVKTPNTPYEPSSKDDDDSNPPPAPDSSVNKKQRLIIDEEDSNNTNSVHQLSDEESNLTPQHRITHTDTDTESINNKQRKAITSSPDLTPTPTASSNRSSLSSSSEDDDEAAAGDKGYTYNPHEMIGKDPLGLDTPTESEDEGDNGGDGNETADDK